MQVVVSSVGNASVQPGNPGLLLFPVARVFLLASQPALGASKLPLVFGKTVQRQVINSIALGGKHLDTQINANDGARRVLWFDDLADCLDGKKPLSTPFTDRDVAQLTQHLAAVSIAQPTQLWQKKTAVALIQFELSGFRKTKAVSSTFPLEPGKACPSGKEILIRSIQIS